MNKLSQFMHKSTTTHWTAVKRLLHYLKHTIFHGIHIRKSSSSQLITYTDADWADNFDDRSSTSAYISFLGPNPISWSLKKQRAIARYPLRLNIKPLIMQHLKLFVLWHYSLNLGSPFPPLQGYSVTIWEPHN